MNLRSFSLYRNYSYPLTLSKVGELSWSWIPREHIQVQKQKQNFVVACLRFPTKLVEISRSRAKTAKKCIKKGRWRCKLKLLFLFIKSIAFLPFSFTSPSSLLKLSALKVSMPVSTNTRQQRSIIIRFWETTNLPLPQVNINTYFSLRAKCWLWGGVGGQFSQKRIMIRKVCTWE